ncbi:Ctr copper transporter family-domain-containing protein [Xylaria castorea]|nr:Ctr copper transporter family-domain-containing protein [Xylaria castorea]
MGPSHICAHVSILVTNQNISTNSLYRELIIDRLPSFVSLSLQIPQLSAGRIDLLAANTMAFVKRHGDSMDGELMTSEDMAMVFFQNMVTPLYSLAWTPNNTHAYAGTCIFLIVLAVIHRALMSLRSLAFDGNPNLVARAHVSSDKESLVSERIRPPQVGNLGQQLRERRARHPFLVSVELGRSLLEVFAGGVGYLLMLAVMTFNVGYFLSVLAGIFLGTFLFGRLGASAGH